jgi:hypothetical protein
MILPGDIVRTSYGTGPFLVTRVLRDCTCAHFVNRINGNDTPLPRHIHIECDDMNGKSGYGLGYYDDSTNPARSVYKLDDYVEVVGHDENFKPSVAPEEQLSLF